MQSTYTEYIDKYIPEINDCILQYFENEKNKAAYKFICSFYDDIIEYCLRPAKRIRSILLLLAYQGYKQTDKIEKDIIKIAALIEIMHSYFLIQDDIIDNARLRRGGEAFHLIADKKYTKNSYNKNGVNIATIITDVIIFSVISFVTELKIDLQIKNNFLKIFAETYQMTSWGQMLDVLNTLPRVIKDNNDIPYQISLLKTAYYTVCNPILMGYILSGVNDDLEKENIKNFALPLGLAFQFRDDILGVFGNDAKIGKSANSDLIEGKYTLLIQETVNILVKEEKEIFIKIFTKFQKSEKDIKLLKKYIIKSNAKSNVQNKINELINKSNNSLNKLAINKNSINILKEIVQIINTIK